MRITNIYMANRVQNSIQTNLSQLARDQEQLATSKRLLRPSDDPNVMGQFLSIKATLSYNEQYNKNIDDGLAYLEMLDTSMGSMGDILHQATEYTIQAANDTYSAEDRKAIAAQIDKMIDNVVDLANSTVAGKYIYAGTNNNHPPFERVLDANGNTDKVIYKGDLNSIMREVAAATDYRVDAPGVIGDPTPSTSNPPPGVFGNITADTTTNPSTITNNTVYEKTNHENGGIFQVLFDLRDRLDVDDTAGLQTSITELQGELDALLKYRVGAGARYRHFDSLKTQLLDQEVKMTASLNNIEGADMAELSIEYSQQQLTYNASLAVGAQIMQTSLLQFLR